MCMNRWKRFASGINTIILITVPVLSVLLSIPLSVSAHAGDENEKTVRVGYVNALNYEEGGEGEYKSGAGYEYLQKISYLTAGIMNTFTVLFLSAVPCWQRERSICSAMFPIHRSVRSCLTFLPIHRARIPTGCMFPKTSLI